MSYSEEIYSFRDCFLLDCYKLSARINQKAKERSGTKIIMTLLYTSGASEPSVRLSKPLDIKIPLRHISTPRSLLFTGNDRLDHLVRSEVLRAFSYMKCDRESIIQTCKHSVTTQINRMAGWPTSIDFEPLYRERLRGHDRQSKGDC